MVPGRDAVTLRRCLILALFVCGCGHEKPAAISSPLSGNTTDSLDYSKMICSGWNRKGEYVNQGPCDQLGGPPPQTLDQKLAAAGITLAEARKWCGNGWRYISNNGTGQNGFDCDDLPPAPKKKVHKMEKSAPPQPSAAPATDQHNSGGFCHNGTWYSRGEVSCLQEDTNFGHKGDCTILNQPFAPICLKVSDTYTPLEVIPCPAEVSYCDSPYTAEQIAWTALQNCALSVKNEDGSSRYDDMKICLQVYEKSTTCHPEK